ncbi:MAG: LysR family transcriptional regulator [Paracoccaceae bacterium]|nr:LysR family transcriptional regulator [Paracoccaceae bacterium]
MDWRDIPPLSSLRAFEAAVRTGSFSAAGRELNVTHAAISQHVRGLEGRLGAELLTRDGLRLIPTDEGKALAEALTEGFGQIVGAVSAMLTSTAQRPLRVSLTPSFAEAWLMPRLGAFWAAHPDIPVELAPSCDVVDLLRDGFDVAIRYGNGDWPGVESVPLVSSQYAIVAAPGHYQAVTTGDLTELKGAHWMLEFLWPEAERWLGEYGIDISKERLTVLGTISLVIQAVRQGHGITIAPTTIAEREVAAGTLEILFKARAESSGYHIATRPGAESPALRKFTRWLLSEAET